MAGTCSGSRIPLAFSWRGIVQISSGLLCFVGPMQLGAAYIPSLKYGLEQSRFGPIQMFLMNLVGIANNSDDIFDVQPCDQRAIPFHTHLS